MLFRETFSPSHSQFSEGKKKFLFLETHSCTSFSSSSS